MKAKLLVSLTAIVLGTGIASQAHAGVSVHIGLPLPPLPRIYLPGVVIAPPVPCPPPAVVCRPPVVAHCAPPVVCGPPYYYRNYGYAPRGHGYHYGHGHGRSGWSGPHGWNGR